MPSNITTIERTYELPHGLMRVVQIKEEKEAAYYANGKRAYFFRSQIIDAMYLFIPVLELAAV